MSHVEWAVGLAVMIALYLLSGWAHDKYGEDSKLCEEATYAAYVVTLALIVAGFVQVTS